MEIKVKEFEFDPKSYLFDMDVESKCGINGFVGIVDNKIYQDQNRVYCTGEFENVIIEFEASNRESSVTKSTLKKIL